MIINTLIKKISITKQLMLSGFLCTIACITRIINYIAFYDNQDGLFRIVLGSTVLNIIFYMCIAMLIFLSIVLTYTVIPYYKRMRSVKPLIIGYALFFVAVMFMVQGLSGFYVHFVDFIEQKELRSNLDLLDYVPILISFLTDLACTLCAFSFYQMAMRCFDEDDAPVRDIKSSIIPAIWSIFTVLQVIVSTTNKLYVQDDIEQIVFCLLNVMFMYYIVKEYCFATQKHSKSIFSLLVQLSHALLSLAIIIPYLILMLFGIKDTIPSMPYFALFGICIYSVVSALRYTLSALVLKKN